MLHENPNGDPHPNKIESDPSGKSAAVAVIVFATYGAINLLFGCEPQLSTAAALKRICYDDTSFSTYIKNSSRANNDSTVQKAWAAAVYPGALVGAKIQNALYCKRGE